MSTCTVGPSHGYFRNFLIQIMIVLEPIQLFNNFYRPNKSIKFIKYHMQLRGSRIRSEKTFYLKYTSKGGDTSKVSSPDDLKDVACYREVHNLEKDLAEHNEGKLYVDDDYQIDLSIQFPNEDNLAIRRLSTLYPLSNRPLFFDLDSHPTRPTDPKKVPHCLNQLALFPTKHYKTLFITQTYSASGKYILITNNDGRFEVISVDDRIPVDKQTLEPIWGLSYKNPWELILVKALAKKLQGYHKIHHMQPFEFIETIWNPTWKYYNLTKSPEEFIHKYRKICKQSHAKIILKTKNDDQLMDHGLLPNSASYQIVKGFVHVNKEKEGVKQEAYFAIRGTSKNSWPGSFSYLDKNSSNLFQTLHPEISVQRCFFMSGEELINNFSAAYLTSIREDNYFTGYKILEIEANEKKAQHFEFEMLSDGFLDFCIRQFKENKVQSRISSSSLNSKRFLQTKYMLVRDNLGENVANVSEFLKPINSREPSGHISMTNSNIISSNIVSSNNNEYSKPRFQEYEIEYLKGYNKGEAHFLYLPKGRYILRLKSENIEKPVRYTLDWVSSTRIDIKQANLSSEEKLDLLHQAIVSFMHKVQHYSLDKVNKTDMISVGQTFEEIGYGFVSVKSAVNCPHDILLEVNPKTLQQEGYTLKGRQKDVKDPFKIFIPKGSFASVVFKVRKNVKEYLWPSKAFKIWKSEGQAGEGHEPLQRSANDNSNINALSPSDHPIQMTFSRQIKPAEEKPNEEKPKEEKSKEVDAYANEEAQY